MVSDRERCLSEMRAMNRTAINRTMSVQEVFSSPASSRSATSTRGKLGVLYEHPVWFERLFAELDRRGIHYHKLLAPDHFYDPGARDQRLAVLFNRMSPSADRRDHGSGILYTQ